MEIKKVKNGYEVNGVVFATRALAKRYVKDLESQKGKKAASSWLNETIDFVYDSNEASPSFKAFIANIALNHRLTMKQIADKLGVTRQTLYNWMDGSVIPDPNSLDKVGRAFGFARSDVIIALIDNFKNAYPELMTAVLLNPRECDAILNSQKVGRTTEQRQALDKVRFIRQLGDKKRAG